MESIVIFGIGDFAKLVSFYLSENMDISAYCVERQYLNEKIFMEKPVVDLNDLPERFPPNLYKIFVAIGYRNQNQERERVVNILRNIGYSFVSYIHKTAVVSKDVVINENTMILENVVVQPYVSIEKNNIIFPNATICHDVRIGENCFVGSSCVINGFSQIGNNSFLGANSTIRDKICIGKFSLIGAGCFINKSTKPYSVYKSSDNVIVNKISTNVVI